MEWESAEAVVARQLMDCMTQANTCTHPLANTHIKMEEAAAAPTASLCFPGDCLA